ncbi:MAG: hypothetical protein E7170_01595 [Firmicutes bacterium]|nr:hypothetical protein [Bacillota bacterium]
MLKNEFFDRFKSKLKLRISGRNPNRFIHKLNFNKIEILNISNVNHNKMDIIIYKKDYERLLEIKSIYDIRKINMYGIIKLGHIINLYKYIISFFVIAIFLIIFLSNIIFSVEVIHNDVEIRNLISKELENYDIKKYKFVKSYDKIQEIKKSILEKYKDKIEWLEITRVGTKYIIRLEDRIIPNIGNSDIKQNVVAKKGAILKKVIANEGSVIKDINTYVNKGDVVISGNIYLNDLLKDTKSAKGIIYGEVWYKVLVEYPFIYKETKETGNYKDVYVLKILNKNIELTKNPFNEKKYEEKVILKNNYIPISFAKQKQKEIINIEEFLNEEQAIEKAILVSKEKLNDTLSSDEYIIDYKVLNKNVLEDKIELEIFFSVLENITEYEEIEGEINDS